MGDAEVARKAGASVMGSGVAVCRDRGGCDTRNGDAGELFCIAGVDCCGDGNADSGILEAAMCGSDTCSNCRDGAGVCENCE